MTPSREGPAESEPPGTSPFREVGSSRILQGDQTAQRATVYWFVFVLLFVGAFGSVRSSWSSSTNLHGVLETISTLLAFVVGSLALVRFYSKKRGRYLYIGTGFLGTALLDTFHTLVTTGLGDSWSRAELQDISSWSFTASATFLSVFLLVSWLSWRREGRSPEDQEVREVPVYLTAAFLTVLIFGAFFTLFDLFGVTQAIYSNQAVHQPAGFFPAIFFLLALAGYLGKGHWRFDPFENWLVVALIIAVMVHAAYMPFSGTFQDAGFVAAHVLKALSYAFVLVGLMASVHATFRREEDAARATREANSALAREIDVRRQAERILQESEERLQDFLDNAHDLIQSVDPEGRFLYVNRAWKSVLGYGDEEVKALNFWEILHPDSRQRVKEDFGRVLRGEPLPETEVDFLARDGRVVRCAGSANARLQDGEAVATRSIFRDITEQEEARRELEAFQANLQALVENTGDAIWSVDRGLRLITFNSAFSMALEARTGREPQVGDRPEVVFPPADVDWYKEMYQRALRGNAFSELRDEAIGGQIRSYELFFNPIREAAGITGVAVFGKDVTARRRTQLALRMAKEEAERANRAKSQFLANMSHELRTPLNSVIGFTNILLKNKSGSIQKQELGFLERISANGKHLLELINEVLDLAKIEAGRMELELETVELGELVKESLAQTEGQVKEKPVELRGVVPEGLDPLETDPGKLKQVIINLVGNALKFTEEGEVAVEVAAGPDGRTPEAIAVRDTGMGIPPERLEAIFEAFQQADGTTSRKFGGTGLGLTISRSLCQLMGYDLKVESEVDEGSVFTILLTEPSVSSSRRAAQELMEEALRPMESSRPRRGAVGKRETEREEADRGRGEGNGPGLDGRHESQTILLVDDDPDNRVLMTHFLEDLGCRILTARSARDGLEKARIHRPDLVTLDLMMPEMTGWQALKAFKEDPELRDIPVVVVSMLAGEGEQADLLGAVDLLAKPVERDDLLRVIERNLDRKRGRVVLVVEDDPETRMVLGSYLEAAGLEVRVAANGKEAEARLAEEVPDIIILDLIMPVMDGMVFLKRLRERPEHVGIPVVICTGKELSPEELDRLRAQASGVVSKGVGFEKKLMDLLSRFFPLRGRKASGYEDMS